jgi:hypothetical protein
MKNPYTIELYGSETNVFEHFDLDDAELQTIVKIAVAINKKPGDYTPTMHIYEGHVEPSFYGNDGAFEEIV